ncbi:CAP domain-containing protein [Patescibacteria group bacterium]|nr:CAP domain-containing protein [Patescibacteria group bacterium]
MTTKGANRIFFLSVKVGFLALLLFLVPDISEGITNYSPSLIDLTNQTRLAFNLPSLQINDQLQQAAQSKLDHMFANNYFEHVSPAGVSPWDFLNQVGYQYETAGENLAMDYIEITDAHDAWMASPSHRQLILNPNYQEIGIAYQKGKINDKQTILIVALFSNPI